MKLLLDTNILLDLIWKREPFYADVEKLCVAAAFGDVQLWVTTQSFADAYYLYCGEASRKKAKQALLETLDLLLPCSTSSADLKPALESDWSDIEDYLIVHAAKRIKADFFITRDAEIAAKSPVPALTAGEFLDHLEREHGLVYEADLEF